MISLGVITGVLWRLWAPVCSRGGICDPNNDRYEPRRVAAAT